MVLVMMVAYLPAYNLPRFFEFKTNSILETKSCYVGPEFRTIDEGKFYALWFYVSLPGILSQTSATGILRFRRRGSTNIKYLRIYKFENSYLVNS